MARDPVGTGDSIDEARGCHAMALTCAAAREQDDARTQPEWSRFERELTRLPVHFLARGRHPRDSVDALRQLLA
jgi:hypothetical protein